MLSVVIPVYNSANSLRRTVGEVFSALEGSEFELILVDDCSTDASWQVIEDLEREHAPTVRGLGLIRNVGQHAATFAGCVHATGRVLITMDDDLQFHPSQIEQLIAPIVSGTHLLAYGVPKSRADGVVRGTLSRTYKAVMRKLIGVHDAGSLSSFRAIDKRVMFGLQDFKGHDFSLDALLGLSKHQIIEVKVEHAESIRGASRYDPWSLMSHFLDILTSFSLRPLRIISAAGILSSLLGFGLVCSLLANYFFGSPPSGFTFLAASTLFFSGLQLLTLGIIGEYVGRTFVNSQGRPIFELRNRDL